ncbi:MAG: hypothetical protein PUB22_01935 [Clostridiales bacterium]|nr:hypothetical protein [Clostridiales bacterium]
MSEGKERGELLEQILAGYEGYFDITRMPEEEKPLAATCFFHVHNSKYVLVKKARLWEADCNEYVYLFSMPELDEETYRFCEKLAYDRGMQLIEPKPGHMYSYITAVFLCDRCTPGARKLLQKCHLYKSFRFSFYGWMDFHTAVIDCSDMSIHTNRSGKDLKKVFRKLL